MAAYPLTSSKVTSHSSGEHAQDRRPTRRPRSPPWLGAVSCSATSETGIHRAWVDDSPSTAVPADLGGSASERGATWPPATALNRELYASGSSKNHVGRRDSAIETRVGISPATRMSPPMPNIESPSRVRNSARASRPPGQANDPHLAIRPPASAAFVSRSRFARPDSTFSTQCGPTHALISPVRLQVLPVGHNPVFGRQGRQPRQQFISWVEGSRARGPPSTDLSSV